MLTVPSLAVAIVLRPQLLALPSNAWTSMGTKDGSSSCVLLEKESVKA